MSELLYQYSGPVASGAKKYPRFQYSRNQAHYNPYIPNIDDLISDTQTLRIQYGPYCMGILKNNVWVSLLREWIFSTWALFAMITYCSY